MAQHRFITIGKSINGNFIRRTNKQTKGKVAIYTLIENPLMLAELKNDVLRISQNEAINSLLDISSNLHNRLSLNEIIMNLTEDDYPQATTDYAHLMQLIGYSISGLADLSCISDKQYYDCDKAGNMNCEGLVEIDYLQFPVILYGYTNDQGKKVFSDTAPQTNVGEVSIYNNVALPTQAIIQTEDGLKFKGNITVTMIAKHIKQFLEKTKASPKTQHSSNTVKHLSEKEFHYQKDTIIKMDQKISEVVETTLLAETQLEILVKNLSKGAEDYSYAMQLLGTSLDDWMSQVQLPEQAKQQIAGYAQFVSTYNHRKSSPAQNV